MSLKPLSIRLWQQAKSELLATFQGYQSGAKTIRDLMDCTQQENESLSSYLERFIQIKAQVPGIPKATVITAVVERLTIGKCATYFAREYPTTVKELFETMRRYTRSDEDYKRWKEARDSMRQAVKNLRPPPSYQ